MHIAYVTDLERKLGGGGSYAVNFHAYDQLTRHFRTDYVGPIVPRPPVRDALTSKLARRVLKRRGRFYYFSPRTLEMNASKVRTLVDPAADAIVYRSSTRWCRTRMQVPYFVYLDAVFHTFFYNTFSEDDFLRSDLQRIFDEEARFLDRAAAVFFENSWGLGRALDAYSLDGTRCIDVGRGGAILPPDEDRWQGEQSIVTMAMNFTQKGGDLVAEAFKMVKPHFPQLTWHILGGPPPAEIARLDGVMHEGVLDPASPAHSARLGHILANAFVLVHPTREDTSPLVITEAGYFGCPSISVARFAIPELIENGVNGFLIEHLDAHAIATAIRTMLEDRQRYRSLRAEARRIAIDKSDWNRVGRKMASEIASALQ